MVGMQYLTIKKCIPLIPLLLGVQHMMPPLKDQRGDAEFDGDAKYDVTPVSDHVQSGSPYLGQAGYLLQTGLFH